MEPSTKLFNFKNTAVTRATFCTKWKSSLTHGAAKAVSQVLHPTIDQNHFAKFQALQRSKNKH